MDERVIMQRVSRLIFLAILLVAKPRAIPAQGLEVKPFVDAHYYDALRAEPHAARIKILVPAWSAEFPDSANPDSRFAWQISLGRELPAFALSSESLNQGRVGAGEFGIGLWLPVAFHMIEDFKDPSNPIVDTDYRFGLMTKSQYGISQDVWLGIRFVPWAHESTHLGDDPGEKMATIRTTC